MRRVILHIAVGACAALLAGGRGRCEPPAGSRPVDDAVEAAAPGVVGPVGDGSISATLRRFEEERAREQAGLLRLPGFTVHDVTVHGPNGGGPGPLSAELRSRIRNFDVAAGVRAEQRSTALEATEWSGRVGVANEHPAGREVFELRTSLGGSEADRKLGVELGPRLERRLRRGTTFFIDGRAAAEAQRPEQGWRSLPGAAGDGSTTVGVTARTGIAR